MVYFTGSKTTFTEVPGKTALVFQISGCPFRCEGCHSAELREKVGEVLTPEKVWSEIVEKNVVGQLEAVCFLGCGGAYEHLDDLFKVVKRHRLEVVLYTGNDHDFLNSEHVKRWTKKGIVDAIKTGGYDHRLGGLDSAITNQRYTHFKHGDLTHKFRRRNGIN
jgi:anaerobic ribonucleoside-triphosphate reductase activating protein